MTPDQLQTHLTELGRLSRALPGQLRITNKAVAEGRWAAAASYADVAAAISASLTSTLRALRDGLANTEQPGQQGPA